MRSRREPDPVPTVGRLALTGEHRLGRTSHPGVTARTEPPAAVSPAAVGLLVASVERPH
jgi:hypothetical protein